MCIKGWGFALLMLSHFSEISHEKEIIWSHRDFYRIFNNRVRKGGFSKPSQEGGFQQTP